MDVEEIQDHRSQKEKVDELEGAPALEGRNLVQGGDDQSSRDEDIGDWPAAAELSVLHLVGREPGP